MSKTRALIFIAIALFIGSSVSAFVAWKCVNRSKGSAEAPVELPEDAIGKITGKAGMTSSSSKTFEAELYNGSEWTLMDVDVVISKKKSWDKRRFRLEVQEKKVEWQKDAKGPNISKTKISLRAYAFGEFEGTVGDFMDDLTSKEDYSWGIVSARGYK